MRVTLIILGTACLLASGCGALNSLIFHPLHVVYEQHEYNEAHQYTNAPEK